MNTICFMNFQTLMNPLRFASVANAFLPEKLRINNPTDLQYLDPDTLCIKQEILPKEYVITYRQKHRRNADIIVYADDISPIRLHTFLITTAWMNMQKKIEWKEQIHSCSQRNKKPVHYSALQMIFYLDSKNNMTSVYQAIIDEINNRYKNLLTNFHCYLYIPGHSHSIEYSLETTAPFFKQGTLLSDYRFSQLPALESAGLKKPG